MSLKLIAMVSFTPTNLFAIWSHRPANNVHALIVERRARVSRRIAHARSERRVRHSGRYVIARHDHWTIEDSLRELDPALMVSCARIFRQDVDCGEQHAASKLVEKRFVEM